MEELQVQSAHVTAPINLLSGVLRLHEGNSDVSREANCGKFSSHYRLDGRHEFYKCNVLTFRTLLADSCRAVCGGEHYAAPVKHKNPLFQPTLVASVKHGHSGVAPFRSRVALDIDTCAGGADAPRYPSAEDLWKAACVFLQANVESPSDIVFEKEPALVFMGSFDDASKRVSAHIYFCDLCWSADGKNQRTNTDPLKKEFDVALSEYGVEWDVQVSNQGLKYPFMDKWDPKTKSYRGKSQLCKFATGGLSLDTLTWDQLFAGADPLVHPSDRAFDRCITLRTLEAPAKRVTVSRPAAVVALGVGSTVRDRIVHVVPNWAECIFRRKAGADGLDVWIPDTTFCPLKTEPSSDSPAHIHGSKGKAYAVVNPLGNINVKCKICAGNLIIHRVESDSADMDSMLTYFNARYARYMGDVIMFPLQPSDGYKIFSHNKFIDHTKHLGKLKVDKKTVYKSQLWLEHPLSRSFDRIVCDPSCTAPETDYNIWQGFDPRVMKLAEEYMDLSDAQLMAKRERVNRLLHMNICNGDAETYDYYMNWIALMMQQPQDKWGTAIILSGPPGCGKGLCVSEVLTMIGEAHSRTCHSQDLSDNYNSYTAEALLIFADEASDSRSTEARNMLKLLVTEKRFIVRQKYKDNRPATTFQKLIMASNEVDAVFMQDGERRFVPVGCDYRVYPQFSDGHRDLCAAAGREIESLEAPAALYVLSMRRDLSNFDPRAFPVTAARFRMRYAGFDKYKRFTYHFIRSGELLWNFDAPMTDMGEPGPLRRKTEIIIANNAAATVVNEIGRDVFNPLKRNDQYPKELMLQAFKARFPNARVADELWKFLYSLFPGQKVTWGVERIGQNKLAVFRVPTQAALKQAFMRVIGEVDGRIWTDWAQLE